jgi:hypothetical protein
LKEGAVTGQTAEVSALCTRIYSEVAPYTMVAVESISATIRLVLEAVRSGIAGDLVECGTWLGGASFAMLLAQRYAFGKIIRPVWMFDSFEGLPAADERDGARAIQYQRETDSPTYFDNCRAPLERVRQAIDGFQFTEDEAVVVPGWFDQTLPANRDRLAGRGIAVLRVDCDWYEPVRLVLDELAPFVSERGAIILDDYFAWDGCVRATHEFLYKNDHPWRIRSMEKNHGAWMIKGSDQWA